MSSKIKRFEAVYTRASTGSRLAIEVADFTKEGAIDSAQLFGELKLGKPWCWESLTEKGVPSDTTSP